MASWSEKIGATLGGLLKNHRGELFQEVDDVYHARKKGWHVKVAPAYARSGYKLGISALKLKPMAFDTEEKAIVHTLAVLYSHDAHKNQLSTLPSDWQTLVKDRLAEMAKQSQECTQHNSTLFDTCKALELRVNQLTTELQTAQRFLEENDSASTRHLLQ